MLEKLSIHSFNTKKRFSIFEIELFIELIDNFINWNHILEIMKLENNELCIINKIDKKYKTLLNKSENVLTKTHRFNWILKRALNEKRIIDFFNKSFIYPIFLWLLSLNLLTFLLIYLLPSMIESFNTLSNQTNSFKYLITFSQFLVGLEWGVLLIAMYLKIKLNHKQIFKIYTYFYKKFPNNLWVYYVSYFYLSDFLYLLNQDISIEMIMNILKHYDSIIYTELSESILLKLKNGYSIKKAFSLIDLTFLKLLQIEDFERKFNDRLENYLKVLTKQIEINIKKYSSYFMTIVYIQIGLMVFLVYSVLLYPLKLIEGINL